LALVTFLKSLSLKIRLTTLFVIIFGTTTVLYSAFFYYSLNESLLQDFDNALYNYSIDVSKNINYGNSDNLLFPVPTVDDEKIFPFASGNSLILIRHHTGKILSRNFEFDNIDFPFKREVDEVRRGADSSYTTLENLNDLPVAEADSYRLITFPLDNFEPPTLFLQIAVPMTTFESQLERFNKIIQVGLPSVLLIAIFAGLYFSSRALRPVQQLIENTRRIDINHLSDRVPLPSAIDEIRTLAETQNLMLDRIEQSFKSQERFVANASHQLLTPLTILRGEIEMDKSHNKSLLQEVDNLSKIVKDMLLLARVEAGNDVVNFQKLEVDEILMDVISRVQKLAKAKNLNIKIDIREHSEKKPIVGDADLLFNMFFNLLENAVKYSPPDRNIFVTLTWDKTERRVDIIDEGIGIPADKMAAIFDRFSRVDPSSFTKGFGLGLAIAKKIADLHGFELKALDLEDDSRTGAHFQVVMKYQT
jgi:signal transduction histidine kinase